MLIYFLLSATEKSALKYEHEQKHWWAHRRLTWYLIDNLGFIGRLQCLSFIPCKCEEPSHGEWGKTFRNKNLPCYYSAQTLLLSARCVIAVSSLVSWTSCLPTVSYGFLERIRDKSKRTRRTLLAWNGA